MSIVRRALTTRTREQLRLDCCGGRVVRCIVLRENSQIDASKAEHDPEISLGAIIDDCSMSCVTGRHVVEFDLVLHTADRGERM